MTNAKSIELLRKLITIREAESKLNKQLLDEIQSSALAGSNDNIGNILYYRTEENGRQITLLKTLIDYFKTLHENTAPNTFE